MIEKQFDITGDTFVLMEHAMDKLNDIDTRLSKTEALLNDTVSVVSVLREELARKEILRIFQDWIGTFLNKLNTKFKKLGGNWDGVNKAFKDNYYKKIDVSQYECVVKLNEILKEINMNFEDLVLLMEMKEDSNVVFHRRWQKRAEAREKLNHPFPNDLEKF
ncbi:unnamed protein product [Rhizophagus irregularis]|uniref:Uncharacterized protein n=1 Tax=Rhizophagus irregularis TaxID=588596 RepID=A0A2I1HEM3_9GLOM|nr:hypothetical protein RhiirA4_478308 [Rhizophagus irregularis]CAB4405533.1 unnamed protein product [Rhizophagus irregularis]